MILALGRQQKYGRTTILSRYLSNYDTILSRYLSINFFLMRPTRHHNWCNDAKLISMVREWNRNRSHCSHYNDGHKRHFTNFEIEYVFRPLLGSRQIFVTMPFVVDAFGKGSSEGRGLVEGGREIWGMRHLSSPCWESVRSMISTLCREQKYRRTTILSRYLSLNFLFVRQIDDLGAWPRTKVS